MNTSAVTSICMFIWLAAPSFVHKEVWAILEVDDTNDDKVEALFARERRGLNPAEAGEAAIKHFLQGARFVIRQRGTKLYEKKGEYIDALREFQSLKPSGLKQHETKMGTEKMVVGMVGDRKIRLMTDTGNNIGWPPYTILHISSTKKGELPYKIVYRNNL